jgi:sigma-E factor negative regulatory protein RseA
MTDEIREQLSALVDDELSDLERPLLLGRLERDPELRACLGRYQLISEVMRGGDAHAAGLGIATRVNAALEGEAPMTGRAAECGNEALALWKPLAGLAVAASVAVVAVLSLQSYDTDPNASAPQVAVNTPQVDATPPAPVLRVSEGDWARIEPRVTKRLDDYLVNHNEFAASRGVQGVMPYVRIVGFEEEQR